MSVLSSLGIALMCKAFVAYHFLYFMQYFVMYILSLPHLMPGFGVWAIAVQVPVMILVTGHLTGHATSSLTLPPEGLK